MEDELFFLLSSPLKDGDKLEKYNIENLPEVIIFNLNKYKAWLD